jgi:hypothetical protein
VKRKPKQARPRKAPAASSAEAIATATLPPDFELAPLQEIDPQLLLRSSDPVGELFLLFAIAFNDIKGAQYLLYRSRYWEPLLKPPEGEVTAAHGQICGMDVQISRLHVGILRELLAELADLHGKTGVLDAKEFTDLVAKAPANVRSDWEVLRALTLGGPKGKARVKDAAAKADWELLERIRNNVSFHYSAPDLAIAYRAHFRGGHKSKERAYFSDGMNMEGTRFYFGDAAMLQLFKSMHDPHAEKVNGLVRRMNLALKTLTCAFLTSRKAAARAAEALPS